MTCFPRGKLAAIRCLFLVAVLFLAAASYPKEQSFDCMPALNITHQLEAANIPLLATAVTETGIAIGLHLHPETREFVIIGMDKDLMACPLISGTDFVFLFEQQFE